MDFNAAINVKNAIASSFLKTNVPTVARISFSMAASPAATNVHKQILSDVNAVGVGEKLNGENFIKVLTRKKTNLRSGNLSQHFGVNAKDIIIEHRGPIRFKTPTTNHRPPYPGISVGHYRITAGTLGCFVKDKKNITYILSNNHVLANTNKGKIKDPILQPGKMDGGKRPKDVIALLSSFEDLEFSKPNSMDAAIAEVVDELNLISKINQKNKISGTADPVNGMKVEKFGRTTGHTKGKISTRNLDLKVDFDGHEIEFQDQFEIKGNNGTMFCDGGDSGSLIFEKGTLKAVGLLFAGTDDGITFATPIKEVLTQFSIKIL
jgi:hypothetical protein